MNISRELIDGVEASRGRIIMDATEYITDSFIHIIYATINGLAFL